MTAGPATTTSGSLRTAAGNGQFTPAVLFAAARLYYEQDATQAEIAVTLGTSRATVSRLLSEARRQGIVRIDVVEPASLDRDDLARQLAAAIGLQAVYVSDDLLTSPSGTSAEAVLGRALAPAVGRALSDLDLISGDVLLVASGRTLYELSGFDLPRLPGVVVVPTVGGADQPEAWYQTNEITRRIAEQTGGRATYLFAPGLPGPDLSASLRQDPTIQRVLHLWPHARAALIGIGAPPLLRAQTPLFVDTRSPALFEAVGDVCSRFFDRAGQPVSFEGSERLMAIELDQLRKIPTVIAVAAGLEKVTPILVGARAGYFNRLVVDPHTAHEVLARA